MTRSFQLPDATSVADLLATDEGEITWRNLLDPRRAYMMTGVQESDALTVYLSILTDARKSGWKLMGSKKPTQSLLAPSFSDSDSRKAHIQRILDLRVSEQQQVDTISEFLASKGSSASEFITNPSSIPEVEEDLLQWFDDIEVIQVKTDEDKATYRYLRHSWRIPYSTTPGRTMSFLVRKKSNSHVIGIFSLASPTLWMSGRDQALGFEQLDCDNTEYEYKEWANRWRNTGMVDDEQRIHPHSDQYSVSDFIESMRKALIRRLEQLPLAIMEGVDNAKLTALGVDVKSTTPDWKLDESERNTAKRIRLYNNCFTSLQALSSADGISSIEELWNRIHGNESSKELLQALKQGLREQKTHVFAGSVADISICGAIPPYNPLRVGKLIAMLTMSDVVSKSWEEKYRDDVSVISSRVAGRPITRGSQFAAMSTTGLYGRGNIQYDRVSIGEGLSKRRMQNIGETGEGEGDKRRGPSTLTISRNSWRVIDGYCETHGVAQGTSGRFGEGTSARIRQLQAVKQSVMSQLPEISDSKLWDRIVLNPFSRSVHVCLLHRKSVRYLLGVDSKLEPVAKLPSVQDVVSHWKSRWLEPALNRKDSRIIETTRSQELSELLPEFGGLL